MTSREALEVRGHSRKPAGRRRRLHRHGTGHRLCHARQQGRAGRGARRHSARAPIPISRGRWWRTRKRRSRKSGSKPRSSKMSTSGKQIKVEMDFDGQQKEELYDRVLVAVGPRAEQRRPRPGKHQGDARRKGFHQGQREAADRRPGDLRHRRHRGRRVARAQGIKEARIAVEVITGPGQRVRRRRHSGGGVHRSGSCVVRFDRSRGEAKGHQRAKSRNSRGRASGPRAVVRPHRMA